MLSWREIWGGQEGGGMQIWHLPAGTRGGGGGGGRAYLGLCPLAGLLIVVWVDVLELAMKLHTMTSHGDRHEPC